MCPICHGRYSTHAPHCPNGLPNVLAWGVTQPEADRAAYASYWGVRS